VAALGVVFCLSPRLSQPLVDAWWVASGVDESYTIVSESEGLFQEGDLFTLGSGTAYYTHLLLLSPLMWGGLFFGIIKKVKQKIDGTDLPDLFFCSFSLIALVLLVFQKRFGEFSAPALSLLYAWAWVRLWDLLKEAGKTGTPAKGKILKGGLVMGVLLALAPIASGIQDVLEEDPVRYERCLLRFGRELAEQGLHSGKDPAGLLTSWGESHALLYACRMPVMISSFGTREAYQQNRKGFALLLAPDEEAVFSGLQEERISVVVVAPILHQVEGMARIAGLKEPLVKSETHLFGDGYARKYAPRPAFFRSVHSRLFLADGSFMPWGKMRLAGLAHFRLLWESTDTNLQFGIRLPLFKAYQPVKGARLTGCGRPGEKVVSHLELRSHTGRTWSYVRLGQVDERGRFELAVAYPSEGSSRAVTPLGLYEVQVGETLHEARVSEQDVLSGGTIQVTPKEALACPQSR
jgi:hypothetical protein